MLPKEERNLILISLGFIIASIPHMLCMNFAGIFYPEAEELFLLEYDWLVAPGTDACYTYSYLGQTYTNCTAVDESRWVSISMDGKSVRFFVQANNTSGISETPGITLAPLSTPVQEHENITLSYTVTNGLTKGRVFYISYALDGVPAGGRYVRLLPKETRELTDSIKAQPGDYALAVHFGDAYDAGRVRINPKEGKMNAALGLPLAFLSFIVPFFVLSSKFMKNWRLLPMISLVAFTAFVSVVNLFDAFDKTSSYVFVGLLWSVSLVAGIIYKK